MHRQTKTITLKSPAQDAKLCNKTMTQNITMSNEVKLNELNWQNNRMTINYRKSLYVVITYAFEDICVYYYDRRNDFYKVPSCCKAPSHCKSIKSAETQIKKFFRNW